MIKQSFRRQWHIACENSVIRAEHVSSKKERTECASFCLCFLAAPQDTEAVEPEGRSIVVAYVGTQAESGVAQRSSHMLRMQ